MNGRNPYTGRKFTNSDLDICACKQPRWRHAFQFQNAKQITDAPIIDHDFKPINLKGPPGVDSWRAYDPDRPDRQLWFEALTQFHDYDYASKLYFKRGGRTREQYRLAGGIPISNPTHESKGQNQ